MTGVTRRRCPYVGLVPYLEEDWEFFVGRETETDLIIANLQASRLTLLYGASGVGKSSVLHAGVAHRLDSEARANRVARGSPRLAVAVFSNWRDDPVAGLSQCVREAVVRAIGKDPGSLHEPPALAEALSQCAALAGGDLLIVLDQFEEYFLYHGREEREGSFAVEFPRCVNRQGLRVNFLLSIRDDAVAQLDLFKGRIPHLFDNYLRLHHLGLEAAEQAIREPLGRFNRRYPDEAVMVEEELVREVLRQTRSGQEVVGQLGVGVVETAGSTVIQVETPYLQMVLTRLWDEEHAAGSRELRLDTFTNPEKLGGAQRIVRTHLDSEMAKLLPEERDIAAAAFRYLVTRSGSKIALAVDDLAGFADLPAGVLRNVLEKLSGGDRRILRPLPVPDQPKLTRYEIFHDVLGPAVTDWGRRREAQRGVEKQRERDRTRFLRIVVVLAAVAIVMLAGVAGYAWQQRGLAREQATEATRLGKEAEQEKERATRLESLATERLNRISAGQEVRRAFFSGGDDLYQLVKGRGLINTTVRFTSTKKPTGSKMKNRSLYAYTLGPLPETVQGGLQSLALITFRMDHESFRNTLMTAGLDRSFQASYLGWGCIRRVTVLIEYVDPDKAPEIASFDMCAAIR